MAFLLAFSNTPDENVKFFQMVMSEFLIQPGEPFGCSLFCSSLFAAVQYTPATHCNSVTFRLSPCRDGSAPFAHVGPASS